APRRWQLPGTSPPDMVSATVFSLWARCRRTSAMVQPAALEAMSQSSADSAASTASMRSCSAARSSKTSVDIARRYGSSHDQGSTPRGVFGSSLRTLGRTLGRTRAHGVIILIMLCLLGPPELRSRDSVGPLELRPKALALLAYLVVTREPQPRNRLAELLF